MATGTATGTAAETTTGTMTRRNQRAVAMRTAQRPVKTANDILKRLKKEKEDLAQQITNQVAKK
jgi:hypothetical protein